MIDFNLDLEKANQSLLKVLRLRKAFASLSFVSILAIVHDLDPSRKGYLTPVELTLNNDPQLQSYLSEKLGTRVSYSTLAAYIQVKDNNSSFVGIDDYEELSLDSLQLLLLTEFGLQKRKKTVLGHLQKYMLHEGNSIFLANFEEYCHCQKLLLDPKILFRWLAGNEQKIDLDVTSTAQPNTRMSENSALTKTKISQLQMSLKRLEQRVQKFGIEWL